MGIGADFIRLTKYGKAETSDMERGLPAPPPEPLFDGKRIALFAADNKFIKKTDLSDAIEDRRSIRKFSKEEMNLYELSYLLWCTQGVKDVYKNSITFRTVPSAGARHALDTYVFANNISGLPAGLYRYLALDHSLGLIEEKNFEEELVLVCMNQDFLKDANAVFVWAADAYRMTWKYGERGYRSLFLDAGHASQNLYLSAEAVMCGVCAIGAFDDDKINGILGLDGENNFTVLMAAVGKKEERE